MGRLDFQPPLLNSANPWATTLEHLRELYNSPYTGAVTVRTSTLDGFPHDDKVHQFGFFNSDTYTKSSGDQLATVSLNTLGYSPLPLAETLENVKTIVNERRNKGLESKPVIISITGTPQELQECIRLLDTLQREVSHASLSVEINLSCPNITGKPPPAFSLDGLVEYLDCLQRVPSNCELLFGIKTPPYSNPENFTILQRALKSFVKQSDEGARFLSIPLHFITATNTLGCSIILDDHLQPALSSADGSGIGGLAGAPLHPLALGNVRMIRSILDEDPALSDIDIIGVGGVSDSAGFERMRAVGAKVVAVGTALGKQGVSVFENILKKS